MTTTSHLGEILIRSKPTNPRLDEKSRSTCATSSLSRLGEPHSLERVSASLKPNSLRLNENLE